MPPLDPQRRNPAGRGDAGALRAPAGAGRAAAAPGAAAAPDRARYKRPFDLAVLALGGVALAPAWIALGAAIALAIRLEDGGTVLYRQARLGRGGRVFAMWKFRSMAEGAEERTGPVWAAWRDPRATAVGAVLRRFHLDELPQVVNVLRGDMSLVGPRPERPELAARFERSVAGFSRRLAVPPGIAGLEQARRGRGITPRNRLRYDLVYIEAMGPWLDVKLAAACAWRALRGPRGRSASRRCVPGRARGHRA